MEKTFRKTEGRVFSACLDDYEPFGETKTFKITNCKEPKLTNRRGRIWEWDAIEVDGEVVEMWIEWNWTKYVYFELRNKWYKANMLELEMGNII